MTDGFTLPDPDVDTNPSGVPFSGLLGCIEYIVVVNHCGHPSKEVELSRDHGENVYIILVSDTAICRPFVRPIDNHIDVIDDAMPDVKEPKDVYADTFDTLRSLNNRQYQVRL